MPEQFDIFNDPPSDGLWRGLGGHFENFSQVICEFIDNSIANFSQNQSPLTNIQITLEDLNGDVKVKIEDTGSGIVDLDKCFSVGKTDKQSPSGSQYKPVSVADVHNPGPLAATKSC